MLNFIRKKRFLKVTEYISDESAVIFGSNVETIVLDNSKIQINGKLLLGIHHQKVYLALSNIFPLTPFSILILSWDFAI